MRYELKPIIENLEIGMIDPPSFQFRSELIVEDLASSIREKGLLFPIIVRVNGDRFQLVAGHRRLLACKKLGLRRIQAQVLELEEKEAFEIGLIENIQRRSMDSLDEARAFKSYVDGLGFGGMTELAGRIGKSVTYVSRRIALLGLPVEVQDRLLRRRKNSSLAIELLSLEDPEDMIEVAKRVDELGLSVHQAREAVAGHLRQTPSESPEEERMRVTIRAIDRCIVALRLALARLDDAVESVQKDWFSKELLFQYRVTVHDHVDSLMHLKKKIRQRADSGGFRPTEKRSDSSSSGKGRGSSPSLRARTALTS